MKRTVPLFITGLVGLVLIVAFFVPPIVEWREDANIWFDILAAIAFILGGGNLLKQNLKKMSDRRPGWGYAAVTVITFLAMLYVGVFKVNVPPAELYPDKPWSGTFDIEGGAFWFGYEYAFKPLTSTMFAMLAFYVASAAFRAFRAKNFEAILLLGTAFIILLGRTFAGVWLTAWMPEALSGLKIDNLTVTIMKVFNTAGTRAIMIGIALGIVSTSLKALLGVDRSYLGKE
jgi:hypothetical protein